MNLKISHSLVWNDGIYNYFTLRFTEIWSDDESSTNIELAEPQLSDYQHYPELILVDTHFCVKLWMKNDWTIFDKVHGFLN